MSFSLNVMTTTNCSMQRVTLPVNYNYQLKIIKDIEKNSWIALKNTFKNNTLALSSLNNTNISYLITNKTDHNQELTKIEKIINNLIASSCHHFQSDKVIAIREYVRSVLANTKYTYKSKILELNILYIYLDNKKMKLPCTQKISSFFECRFQKIIEQTAQLKNNSKVSYLKVSTYMLRKFVHLIIDKQGKVNEWATYAVLNYLTRSFSLKYFHETHLFQIGNVLRKIRSDPQFLKMFERTINVKSSMEIFIRMSLDIPITKTVKSYHVQMACLLALLVEIRPNDFKSDYMGVLIFLIRSAPILVLHTYHLILKNGCINLNTEDDYSYFRLFLERIVKDQKFDFPLTLDQIAVHSMIHPVLEAAQLDIRELTKNSVIFNLQEFWHPSIRKQAKKFYNYFAWHTNHAGKISKNPLQEMLCSLLEFEASNTSDERFNASHSKLNSMKAKFMEFFNEEIILKIFSRLIANYAISCSSKAIEEFFGHLQKKIAEKLWLQNIQCLFKYSKEKRSLFICLNAKWHVIENYTYPSNINLENDFKNIRSFFYFKDKQKIPLETCEDLEVFCKEMVDDTLSRYPNPMSSAFALEVKILLAHYITNNTICSNYIYRSNPQGPLTQQNYYASGLLFLHDDGGLPNSLLHSLKIFCGHKEFKKERGEDNIYQLLSYLSDQSWKMNLSDCNEYVLCSSNCHTFSLYPYAFFPLIEKELVSVLQNRSVIPLYSLMKEQLPIDVRIAILERVFLVPIAKIYEKYTAKITAKIEELQTEALTGINFIKTFKKNFPHIAFKKFIQFFEQEITQITLTTISWEAFFEKLGILFSLRAALKENVIKKFANIRQLRPLQIVRRLQEVFTSQCIFFSTYHLERVFCEMTNMPISWTLGELNSESEKKLWEIGDLNDRKGTNAFEKEMLVIKMMPNEDSYRFTLFVRKGERERYLKKSERSSLENLTIYHPYID